MRKRHWGALLFLAAASSACTLVLGDFHDVEGTGGAGSTSSSHSTGTTIGHECTASVDCDDQNPCTSDACNAGRCDNTPQADGPVPGFVDMVKDCQTEKCVAGKVTAGVPDDSDVPASTSPCVTSSCSMGKVVMTNVTSGMSCGTNQQCDGMGVCVGCTKSSDCSDPGACKQVACNNHQCTISNDTAGTMCSSGGGKVCDSGGMCVPCINNGDCGDATKLCVNNQCQSSCGDAVLDGTETDVDCGGNCTPCANGKKCLVNGDCTSGSCNGNGAQKTCQAATCNDGVQDGTETDVDCGGATCDGMGRTCANNKKCSVDADCNQGHCNPSTMKCATQCADGVKDGTETDVDCGGSCVATCADGKGCAANADCTSGSCNTTTHQCATSTCMVDSIKDGAETDVDCGGPACDAIGKTCALNKKCSVNADCTSGNCPGGFVCF